MDCLLGSIRCCRSPVRKSRSLKKQASSKKYTEDSTQEQCREWPVDASQYELLVYAGKGAHAVVYKGQCKAFDEVVAIKCLDLDCNWDLTALVREATIMKKFNHPAVLPLYAAFVAGRELWFVTPYMGAGSVRSIMKQQFPLGLDEVVIATIMHPVLLALEYVHKNNGIHRDVKADNILVSEDGEVVLADFGVVAARMREVSMVNLDMQAVMTFVGTPCWMAPEVMEQTVEGYHTSADIWSFGITLIELAHGRPPLARMHPMRVLMDTMHKPPPQLDDHPNGTQFSKAFKELVEDCLQKDPDQRPSAAALLNHKFFRMARDPAFLQEHLLASLAKQQQQQQGCVHPAAVPDSPGGQKLQQQQQQQPGTRPGVMGAQWRPSGPQLTGKKHHQQPGAGIGATVAGRAGSGLLSGSSLSSGPSRLISSWFFPQPNAANLGLRLSTHSEDPSESEAAAEAADAAIVSSGTAAAAGSPGRLPSVALSSPTGTARQPSAAAHYPTGTARPASAVAGIGLSLPAVNSVFAAGAGQGSASSSGLSIGSVGMQIAGVTCRSSGSSLEQQLQPFILQQAAMRAGYGLLGPSFVAGPVQLRTSSCIASSTDQHGQTSALLQQAAAGRTGSALGAGHSKAVGQGAPQGAVPLPDPGVTKGLEGLRLGSARPFSSPLPAALLGTHMEVEDGVGSVGGGVAGTEAAGLRQGSVMPFSSSLPAALLETHKEAEDGGDAGDAGVDLGCGTAAAEAPAVPGSTQAVEDTPTTAATVAASCADAAGAPPVALEVPSALLGPPCADAPVAGCLNVSSSSSAAGPDTDALVRVITAAGAGTQEPDAVCSPVGTFPASHKQQPQQAVQLEPQQC